MTVRDTLWKFLQDVVKRANSGYFYAVSMNYPLKKSGKWLSIDKKLTKKYLLDLNRNQRAYRKRKSEANYFGARYGSAVILQRTIGNDINGDDEKWQDIAQKPLKIRISEHLELEIGFWPNFGDKCCVKLSKKCYQELKALAKLGHDQKNPRIYKQLSDLPAVTAPFHKQKETLLKIAKFRKNSAKK